MTDFFHPSTILFQITPMKLIVPLSFDHLMYSMCILQTSVRGLQRHVSLSTHCQDRYLFYVPARQSDIPDNAALHPLNFSFPALIYFFSFWPLLSPRQFSQRKNAESATLFHLEVKLEVLKGLACNPPTIKIL